MAESELQRGAQDERDAVKAYLDRRIKSLLSGTHYNPNDRIEECQETLRWLAGRTKRFNRAPGGLGRKAKAK